MADPLVQHFVQQGTAVQAGKTGEKRPCDGAEAPGAKAHCAVDGVGDALMSDGGSPPAAAEAHSLAEAQALAQQQLLVQQQLLAQQAEAQRVGAQAQAQSSQQTQSA